MDEVTISGADISGDNQMTKRLQVRILRLRCEDRYKNSASPATIHEPSWLGDFHRAGQIDEYVTRLVRRTKYL